MSLAESYCSVCQSVEKVLSQGNIKQIVIQGDTTSACEIAKVAFYNQVKVASGLPK
jgi:UDP-N-acetylglucosamine 2-epimerase